MTETSSLLKSEPFRFKFFPQLNALSDLSWVSTDTYITKGLAQRHFNSERLGDKLVSVLAAKQVLPVKEILEACEFFERVRKDVRAETVADFCCGHGFLGILFGVFERQVERILLIDTKPPPSFRPLMNQISTVAPWIVDKVQFTTGRIDTAIPSLSARTSIVSSHACGLLTDTCLSTAMSIKGQVAVMPCCYPKSQCTAPRSLQLNLGHELAFDIDRIYRLEQAGYRVRWTSIPKQITPMNRIIVGRIP